jgi:methionyl-tRNA synthetase
MTPVNPSRFYVTTAIPYVNGAPHVGHALEAVQTDALARYHRQIGDDTYFLTGSDDNSIKNVKAAEEEGIPVGELVSRNTKAFIDLDRQLAVSYDQYIRTSVDQRHRAGATKLWQAIDRKGDIYRKDYSGLYCPSCELFYDQDELEDGLCPEHLIPPEQVQEENYFFSLSRYQSRLEQLIEADEYRVVPVQRKNEVLSFIRSGLQDISISRSMQRARGWGVPVPGDEGQVMYVWFDALANYITALDYAGEGDLYRRYWLENPCRVHVIGKGIIRFHAVYWPAFLLSAGVPLPTTLFVHGYYTVEGRKMGKSMGNALSPSAIVERYGVDAARYYFVAATHPTADADFSLAEFEARYNADLANDLGNLLNRSVTMIRRYREGRVPAAGGLDQQDRMIRRRADILDGRVREAMTAFDFQQATAAIWELIGDANRYIEVQAPWKVARSESAEGSDGEEARARMDAVLSTLAEVLRVVGIELRPFLPHAASEVVAQLGLGSEFDQDADPWSAPVTVGEPRPLFPRIERPDASA